MIINFCICDVYLTDAVQPVQPVEFSTIAADADVLTAVPRSQAKKRRGAGNSNRGKSRSKRVKQVTVLQ